MLESISGMSILFMAFVSTAGHIAFTFLLQSIESKFPVLGNTYLNTIKVYYATTQTTEEKVNIIK